MTRFGEQYLEFDDPHGLHIELVEREAGELNNWSFGEVTPEVAIKGVWRCCFYLHSLKTAELLEHIMGLEKLEKRANLFDSVLLLTLEILLI